MFETLNTIDWPHAQSCYGTSEEIPAAIRELVSADASVRDRARGTLWMSLEHQGSVYEASALAVPFLLAILADPQTQDKRQLVHFLAHLGCRGLYLGHWYENLQTRLVLQRMKEDKTVFSQDARDRHRRWEEDTHQGFREGLHIFLPLLSDPDPAIREAVAFLLATFPEDRSRLLPPLITQLQTETNEQVQCSLLLCLGYLLTPTPDASQLLLHYLEEGETQLLQFTAARALCTLLKAQTPEKVVQVLFEVLTHPHPLQPSYEHLSPLWGSGWIHAKALYYLDQLTASPYQMLILERLIELFPALDERVDLDCADLLVRVAFYEKQFRLQPHITFTDLDPMQQSVLRTLAAKETPWVGDYPRWDIHFQTQVHFPPAVGALVCVGLPATRRGLQAFMVTGQ
jgi:hypothetical protein